MIRLIACDLDGTLLLNKAERVSDRCISQIRELRERGIHFAAASGRQYANLRRLFHPVADEISYLCENGSLVRSGDAIFHCSRIDKALLDEIILTIRNTPNCDGMMSGVDAVYIEPDSPAFSYRVRFYTRNRCFTVPDLTKVTDPAIKISLYEPDGYQSEVVQMFMDRFGGRMTVVTAGNDWIDLMPTDSGKGVGIRALADGLKIPLSDVMAIGDNLNDNAMLEAVGHPVAMNSGHVETKKLCPVTIDLVEDYIDYLLKEKL